jgi:hypothetical protein
MSLKWLATLSVVCVALLTQAGVAHAQKLVKAEFYSKTGDDNKDKDTGVYVTVVTNDGKTVLAEIKNADNSGDDKTEYNDNSDHTIDLVVKSPGSTKADCQKFKFRVGSQAKGNDKWKITKATVTLTFDDNTALTQEAGAFELNSRGSKYVESEWFGGK